jgi:hypothetical protein
MADNIGVSTGTAATIATDDISSVHYQRVKLVDGTLDSTVGIPGGTNGLKVELGAMVPTGTNIIGTVKCGDGSNLVAVGTAGADGESNTANRLKVESYNDVFNGTTWDRSKGDVAGNWVRPFPGRAGLKSGTATATGTASTQVIAGVASNYMYIVGVVVHNSSAVDTFITLQDGTGGTSLAVFPAPAKGGAALSLPVPLLVPTSGNGLFFVSGGSATTMYVSAVGYVSTV